ncbi:MAG: phospho-N-acetylmuramoyl-pentapeptide-transferase [Acidimicrobiales bacterium]|nr:phospho-N-acetylmuramoyl-pentapeptide-transferase [Acidimicrobiales bacterium]
MIALLLAGGISLLVSLFGTRFLIDWLRARRVGQPIMPEKEGGPVGHDIKAGTPTMGGVAIVVAAGVGYVLGHVPTGVVFTTTGLCVILAVVGAGAVGFLDDWIKIANARNLGLTKSTKVLGLLAVATGFAVLALSWGDVHTTLSFTRYDSPGLELGNVGWALWAVLLVLGSANAVNLTDGLDGLAAGSSALAFAAFVVIAFWAFRHPSIYDVRHGLDLAVVAAAMVGALAGFLWWNASPAQIFMGDTGALAIGAGLAALALSVNTQLLLPIIGGLFVLETLSVMLQVASYRVFHRRIFRMAPFHHHFEVGGWPETTVIVRFWILAGLFTGLALAIFYADFISTGALD